MDLLRRIVSRDCTVGVIGLGYVGLPLCLAMGEAGLTVIGFDVDDAKADALNEGRSYLRQFESARIAALRDAGRLSATSDMARLNEPDVIVICVPTPLTRHREPDLSFVEATTQSIAPALRPGQLVILESTTYPGTTDEVVGPILASSGLEQGKDFWLAFSPEREDPGNLDHTTTRIPKIVGGSDDISRELAVALYSCFVDTVVPVSSNATAEAVKITENVFRAVNIALANELKLVFSRMGIDVWEVIEAASTKPFGFMPFYPGPGLGGHCIPIDPFYLSWKAREYDISSRFIELAGEINAHMPEYVVQQLQRALDERLHKGLNGSRILMIGAAYKKNVADQRESPALRIMKLLGDRGAKVDYHDPLIPELPPTREYPQLAGRRSISLENDVLSDYDAVLVVTDHDAVDYVMLAREAKLLVDTRNACARAGADLTRVVSA